MMTPGELIRLAAACGAARSDDTAARFVAAFQALEGGGRLIERRRGAKFATFVGQAVSGVGGPSTSAKPPEILPSGGAAAAPALPREIPSVPLGPDAFKPPPARPVTEASSDRADADSASAAIRAFLKPTLKHRPSPDDPAMEDFRTGRLPPHAPLIATKRYRALLGALAGRSQQTREIDIQSLAATIAAGRPTVSLPRRQKRGFARGVQILRDLDVGMRPFRRDMDEFVRHAVAILGRSRVVARKPLRDNGTAISRPSPGVAGGVAILLSDLHGAAEAYGFAVPTRPAWREFDRELRRLRIELVVLAPGGPAGEVPEPLYPEFFRPAGRRGWPIVPWNDTLTPSATARYAAGLQVAVPRPTCPWEGEAPPARLRRDWPEARLLQFLAMASDGQSATLRGIRMALAAPWTWAGVGPQHRWSGTVAADPALGAVHEHAVFWSPYIVDRADPWGFDVARMRGLRESFDGDERFPDGSAYDEAVALLREVLLRTRAGRDWAALWQDELVWLSHFSTDGPALAASRRTDYEAARRALVALDGGDGRVRRLGEAAYRTGPDHGRDGLPGRIAAQISGGKLRLGEPTGSPGEEVMDFGNVSVLALRVSFWTRGPDPEPLGTVVVRSFGPSFRLDRRRAGTGGRVPAGTIVIEGGDRRFFMAAEPRKTEDTPVVLFERKLPSSPAPDDKVLGRELRRRQPGRLRYDGTAIECDGGRFRLVGLAPIQGSDGDNDPINTGRNRNSRTQYLSAGGSRGSRDDEALPVARSDGKMLKVAWDGLTRWELQQGGWIVRCGEDQRVWAICLPEFFDDRKNYDFEVADGHAAVVGEKRAWVVAPAAAAPSPGNSVDVAVYEMKRPEWEMKEPEWLKIRHVHPARDGVAFVEEVKGRPAITLLPAPGAEGVAGEPIVEAPLDTMPDTVIALPARMFAAEMPGGTLRLAALDASRAASSLAGSRASVNFDRAAAADYAAPNPGDGRRISVSKRSWLDFQRLAELDVIEALTTRDSTWIGRVHNRLNEGTVISPDALAGVIKDPIGRAIFASAFSSDATTMPPASDIPFHAVDMQIPGSGMTPLHAACLAPGSTDVISRLLELGAEIEARDALGNTPIRIAAFRDDGGAAVSLLLDRGANPSAKNTDGSGMLGGSIFPREAPETNFPPSLIRRLISSGASVTAPSNQQRWRPIQIAAIRGDAEIVGWLLDEGADPNEDSGGFDQPLAFAVKGGHEACVQLLLSRGAEVDARGSDGETALHIAASTGREEVVSLLIAAGADIEAKNSYGVTPIHAAVGRMGATPATITSARGVLGKLLAAGALVDVGSGSALAPILTGAGGDSLAAALAWLDFVATEGRPLALVDTCLALRPRLEADGILTVAERARIDFGARNKRGTSLMHLFAAIDHPGLLKLAREAGADLAATDAMGATPLHVAAAEDSAKAVRYLREAAPSSVDARLTAGLRPGDVAAAVGSAHAAPLLPEKPAVPFRSVKSPEKGERRQLTFLPWSAVWEDSLPSPTRRLGAAGYDSKVLAFAETLVFWTRIAERHAPVPLGGGGRLIETFWRRDDGVLGISGIVEPANGGEPVVLDGGSFPIHRLNANAPPDLANEASARSYLGLFCAMVHGEEGPFSLIPDSSVLAFSADAAAETRMRAALLPYENRLVREGKGWWARAVVRYGNALFVAEFRIHPEGRVDMIEDNLLADELSLRNFGRDGNIYFFTD